MKKRTLLSRRKAVKCLTILAVMFAAAIPATAREAKAAAGTTFKVKVSDGYLALRSEKAFDKSNEIYLGCNVFYFSFDTINNR
mgnify:CR=1 FL=1